MSIFLVTRLFMIIFCTALILGCSSSEGKLDILNLEFHVLYDEKVWYDGSELSVLTLVGVHNDNMSEALLFSTGDSLVLTVIFEDSVIMKDVLSENSFTCPIRVPSNDSTFVCHFYHENVQPVMDNQVNNAAVLYADKLNKSKIVYDFHYTIHGEHMRLQGELYPSIVTTCPKFAKFLCFEEGKYLQIQKHINLLK